MPEYSYLTKEQREFFLEHWMAAYSERCKILDKWMSDFWVRLGWDEHDKSTWKLDYLKMPKHHEIPPSDFSPDAWKAMCEIVGGEDKIDKEREYLTGDNFIANFGSEYWKTHPHTIEDAKGWHTDNDYYRQFLDSSTNALTIINCLPTHVKNCKKFATVEAKAGDVFITHALLTLCEQVILRALGRDSVSEFKPTRPREVYFPRTFTFKRARVQEELDRLVAAAEAKGLPADSHEKRNGYDRPHGPGGLCLTPEDPVGLEFEKERMNGVGSSTESIMST
ncbi:hypothetical protein C8J57DRAFT_1325134 [Mycena rebaudengoi]|nr:hypothetical protein C8J57DRAFT_1325134 [Mycena rebaudengoi]